jgi:sulfur carrier protein
MSATIELLVNGEPRQVPAGLPLEDLLTVLGYRPQLVVVEFNGEILPRQRWTSQPVTASDVLEVVTIVGGGSSVAPGLGCQRGQPGGESDGPEQATFAGGGS